MCLVQDFRREGRSERKTSHVRSQADQGDGIAERHGTAYAEKGVRWTSRSRPSMASAAFGHPWPSRLPRAYARDRWRRAGCPRADADREVCRFCCRSTGTALFGGSGIRWLHGLTAMIRAW